MGLQVATATSLGFVSVLLLRSMANVYDVDLGFQAGESFVFRVQLPQEHYRCCGYQQVFNSIAVLVHAHLSGSELRRSCRSNRFAASGQ